MTTRGINYQAQSKFRRLHRYTYTNTKCQIKLNGDLSREYTEERGSQERLGPFQNIFNPCLDTADTSWFKSYVGPVCVNIICVANDTYILSDHLRKLQDLIEIISH